MQNLSTLFKNIVFPSRNIGDEKLLVPLLAGEKAAAEAALQD